MTTAGRMGRTATVLHAVTGRRPPTAVHALILVMLAGFLVAAMPLAVAAQTSVTEEDVTAGVHARQKYGLDARRESVRSILVDGTDVGSDRWSIPMTRDESDQLDMADRMRFEIAVHKSVMPYVESLDAYGGAFFDQQDGGRLVILLTSPTDRIKDEIRSRLPVKSRGVTFARVEHTRQSLERAFSRAFAVWNDNFPDVEVEGFAVDDQRNALIVDTVGENANRVSDRAAKFQELLGVRVLVSETTRGSDLVCNDRSHCHNPLRAGIQIYGGYLWHPTVYCSMGFAIWVPASETSSSPHRQFLTAGHCTYLKSNWYHWKVDGNGLIGAKKKSQYGNSFKRDIARVGINDSDEISYKIFGEGTPEVVHQPVYSLVQGETLCMSLPRFKKNVAPQQQNGQGITPCGTVAATSQTWKSETANRIVHGASLDSNSSPKKTAIPGDSGSPIYKLRYQAGGTYHLYPYGILDHERYPKAGQTPCPKNAYGCHDFYFAVIKSAFNQSDWDEITIYD